MSTETGYLRWDDRAARDEAYDTYFRGRTDIRKFHVASQEEDDYQYEDGDSELSTMQPGYYIEVPIAVRRAWIAAQRERNDRGLRGPEHEAARKAVYDRHLGAVGCAPMGGSI